MTDREAILAEAFRKYPFRNPNPFETGEDYARAFYDHLRKRDMGLAHELRLGKRQAKWSPKDVESFLEACSGDHGPSEEFDEGVHAIPMVTTEGHPVTTEELLTSATRLLDYMMSVRRKDPTGEVPIMVGVLLDTGRLMEGVIGSSRDRLAVLKFLVRTQPVFGFFITFDAFMHRVDKTAGTATKQDCLMMRIGTRDLALMKTRPYRVKHNVAIFDDPPPDDINMRDQGVEGRDAYSSVFVSVPASTGPPS